MVQRRDDGGDDARVQPVVVAVDLEKTDTNALVDSKRKQPGLYYDALQTVVVDANIDLIAADFAAAGDGML